MAALLTARDLEKSFGAHALFSGLTLAFDDNESVGLIGPNGAGKSTLLRILAGLEPLDGGKVEVARGKHVAYLAQSDLFPPEQTVLAALTEAQTHLPMEEHDREAQARIMASRLGFTDAAQTAGTLSGGWRKRLAVGCRLVAKPDLLLLDEPTNHLDLAGIAWLERFLRESGTAFVMVSHDRYFLENVCSRIVEINRQYPGGHYSAPGKYSDFLEARAAWLDAEQRREQRLANLVRRDIEWLRRGPQARRTKAQGKIKEAHRKIGELADMRGRLSGRDPMQIDFAATGRKSQDLIEAADIGKTLGGKKLFSKLDLDIGPGTRLGIVGNNGTGKSTLLHLLAGTLQADTGQIKRIGTLRQAVFDQRRESLDPNQTLRRALAPEGDTILVRGAGLHVVGWAQRFLFRADQLESAVGTLSGGEKARVLLAALMRQEADVLFLDEPTNDLDIPSIEMLEQALDEFPGAVVLITHDRYLLESLCTEFVGLHPGGNCGVYADLLQWQRAEDAFAKEADAARNAAKTAEVSNKPQAGKKPGLSREEEREWKQMERKILAAEERAAQLEEQAHDPAVMKDHAKMAEVCRQLHDAKHEIETLFSRWSELDGKR